MNKPSINKVNKQIDYNQYNDKYGIISNRKGYYDYNDIYKYEKYCQDFVNSHFLPLNNCEFLYRTMYLDELCQLVSYKKLEVFNEKIGFSFSKDKLYSKKLFVHESLTFLVTFNADVLRRNFDFVEVIPNIEFFKQNPDILYHISGLMYHPEKEEVIRRELFHEIEYSNLNIPSNISTIDLLDIYVNNIELIFDNLNDKYHQKYKDKDGNNVSMQLLNFIKNYLAKATIPEVIIKKSYHFVNDMLVNIEAPEYTIDRFKFWCYKHQEELGIEL
jgi:hypothetical protein